MQAHTIKSDNYQNLGPRLKSQSPTDQEFLLKFEVPVHIQFDDSFDAVLCSFGEKQKQTFHQSGLLSLSQCCGAVDVKLQM